MSQNDDALKRHRVVFEPPDILTSAPIGTLGLDDAQAIWQFADASCAQTDRIYWLSDISRLDRYAPGDPGGPAKKVLNKMAATAVIGGNFQQRTLITVILRAARLLGLLRADAVFEFFQDESSARAWVDSLKNRNSKTM
jgi:hypothetical protein